MSKSHSRNSILLALLVTFASPLLSESGKSTKELAFSPITFDRKVLLDETEIKFLNDDVLAIHHQFVPADTMSCSQEGICATPMVSGEANLYLFSISQGKIIKSSAVGSDRRGTKKFDITIDGSMLTRTDGDIVLLDADLKFAGNLPVRPDKYIPAFELSPSGRYGLFPVYPGRQPSREEVLIDLTTRQVIREHIPAWSSVGDGYLIIHTLTDKNSRNEREALYTVESFDGIKLGAQFRSPGHPLTKDLIFVERKIVDLAGRVIREKVEMPKESLRIVSTRDGKYLAFYGDWCSFAESVVLFGPCNPNRSVLEVVDVNTGSVVSEIRWKKAPFVSDEQFAISPSGKYVALWRDQMLHVWRIPN